MKQSSGAVRTLNALSSGPLKYRTFGGNYQSYERLDPRVLENAFGGHYLLTQLTQCAILKKLLYTEAGSRHTLYCDGSIYGYFDGHGLFEQPFWDEADFKTLDENISPENTDMRIYYSAGKPDALTTEAQKARKDGTPVFFIDSDLILKRRHDAILRDSQSIRAAYAHREEIGTECYPDFSTLHLPEGYPESIQSELPAVNTCLMFFNDLELLEAWCGLFKELFIGNFIEGPVTDAIISAQLLGIDQRTFPIIAERRGCWDTDAVVPFMDISWSPPRFISRDGSPAHWHYYTLEPKPEHPEWMQDITHIWISKKFIEKDAAYRGFQGCLMLETILTLMPEAEQALRSFSSLTPYFDLLRRYGNVDAMLAAGVVLDKLRKDVL